ncbi:MAG: NDP-sugar synthase [Candidatus Obscuribacterales bacterium]|nr:NDP-sugar synthase [Candidatus Obscuribacterales bacterium]
MIKAMVLAAGVGSRLDPLSRYMPKPLVPVLNIPVMEHVLWGLKEHGIENVISNTHYMADSLVSYFTENPPQGIKLNFLHEKELSGDAGGVRACKDFLEGDTFVVIMGDLITNANISKLIAAHKKKNAIATIGVKKMPDVTRFGVMKRDAEGFIQAFQEKPKAEEAISHEISTGIYILEPEIFEHIPKTGSFGFGKQLFPSLLEKRLALLGEDIDGHWSDIGTLNDLFKANMDALEGKIKVSEAAPKHEHEFAGNILGKNVLLGKNLAMGANSKISDFCIIGDNCKIGNDVQLEHCMIIAGAKIPDKSVMRNCIYAFDELIPVAETVGSCS